MQGEWTRERVISYIKKDLLLNRLGLAASGVTLSSIKDDTQLFGEGLSLDSVDALDLFVGIENEFGVKLPSFSTSLIESTCKNVGNLADFIVAHIEKSAAV